MITVPQIADFIRHGISGESVTSSIRVPVADLRAILTALDDHARLQHVADTMQAVSEALRTRYASDSQAAYFMRQIDSALAAVPREPTEIEAENARQGLPPGTSLATLISHHRASAGLAATFDALATVLPEVVSTPSELDRLPVGSVVRDHQTLVLERYDGGWRNGWNAESKNPSTLMYPVTVLYRPDSERGVSQ